MRTVPLLLAKGIDLDQRGQKNLGDLHNEHRRQKAILFLVNNGDSASGGTKMSPVGGGYRGARQPFPRC
jgi:hypothetical protein